MSYLYGIQAERHAACRRYLRAWTRVWSAAWKPRLTAGRGWSRCRTTVDTSAVEISSTISGSSRPPTAAGASESEITTLSRTSGVKKNLYRTPTNLHLKRHSDRFSVLAQLIVATNRQTHIHRDHATTVTIVRIYIMLIRIAVRPKMSQRLQESVLATAKLVMVDVSGRFLYSTRGRRPHYCNESAALFIS